MGLSMVLSHSPVAVLLDLANAPTAMDQRFVFRLLARAAVPRRVLGLLSRLCGNSEMAVYVGQRLLLSRLQE